MGFVAFISIRARLRSIGRNTDEFYRRNFRLLPLLGRAQTRWGSAKLDLRLRDNVRERQCTDEGGERSIPDEFRPMSRRVHKLDLN
jgi:hypothetical protein